MTAQPSPPPAGHDRFLATSLHDATSRHLTEDPARAALELFREVAATVPAYGKFLAAQGIDPATIGSPADFARLPLVTRANYLTQYPLPELCRNGRLHDCDMVAVSSGSTGQPTFWPRAAGDESEVAFRFEQIFHDSFAADRRRTLAIVCFALGTWVGGMYTAACCRHLAAKGYPLTVVTPGNNPREIFRVVEELGAHFDQTVLLGYPPFIKDVIDSGLRAGVRWPDYSIKTVFAGEVFSEEWRALIAERTGSTDLAHDSASLYGTADAGVLGNETPLSIAIRRHLSTQPGAARELFGESRLPTLVQYDPLSRYFECIDGSLLFSGDNGVPLVRYHIADNGGVVSFADMMAFAEGAGFDYERVLGTELPREMPFVFVFGRSHFAISYYGANLYPENVTVGLEQPQIKDWVTGKFVMQVREDSDRDRHLFVAVELAPGEEATASRHAAAADSIQGELRRLNSEFAHYVPAESQVPRIDLRPAGDPDYFPVGVKHRYTRP